MNRFEYNPFDKKYEYPKERRSNCRTCVFSPVAPINYSGQDFTNKMVELPSLRKNPVVLEKQEIASPTLEKVPFSWKLPIIEPILSEKKPNLNEVNKQVKMSGKKDVKIEVKKNVQPEVKKKIETKTVPHTKDSAGWETVTHVKPKKPKMPLSCKFGDQCRLVSKQGNLWFNTRYDRVCNFSHPNEQLDNYEKRIKETRDNQPPPPKDITLVVRPPQANVRVPKELASSAITDAFTCDRKNIKFEYK